MAVAAGMLFISGNVTEGSDVQTGLLLGAGAAALYALIIIVTKRVTHMSGLSCSTYELFISFIVMIFYLLINGIKLPVIPSADDIVYVLIIGFVNTGLAYYMYFSALQKLPAQTSSLISYVDPLTALMVSALFLGERLGAVQLLGAALILGGACLGELKLKNEIPPSKRMAAVLSLERCIRQRHHYTAVQLPCFISAGT